MISHFIYFYINTFVYNIFYIYICNILYDLKKISYNQTSKTYSMSKKNPRSLKAAMTAIVLAMAAHPAMAQQSASRLAGGTDRTAANFISPLKAAARAASRDLWGYMYYAKAWPTASHQYGFMAFDAATASNFRDLRTEEERNMLPNGGSSYRDGKYDLINYKRVEGSNSLILTHYQFNTERSWASVFAPESVNEMALLATETATSQLSGKVYGQFYTTDMSSFEFGTIDYDKMERTSIAASQHKFVAMGVSSEERVYGVATDGYLYEIDTQTGEERRIGPTGVYVAPSSEKSYGQSGEIDQDDDTFYWASFDANQHGALYTVDLKTGLATLIADFPHNELIYGLAVPEATPADAAPAAPTDVNVKFENASTTGYMTINTPSKTYGGSSLSGELTYTVRSGQHEIATGKVNAGSSATIKVTAPEGMNYFTVTLANAAGKSKAAKVSAYVGYDKPKQVSFARLKIDKSGNATVTWGAPSAGQNGGYVGTLKYDVTRYPDGKKVATGISATSFTDKIEGRVLQNYYYGVTPVNGTQRGPERRTAAVKYGDNIEPPYAEAFDTENSFDLFSTIDANGDSKTWEWDSETLCAKYSSANKTADDWLVTPPVHLQANHAYTVKFKASKSMAFYNESIEARWGNSASVAGLTNTLLGTTNPATSLTEYSKDIRSDKDQVAYFGIHVMSPAQQGRVSVDDFSITDQGCLDGPEAVSDFTITPDASTALKAHLSFRLAEKNVGGGTVAAITKVTVYRDDTLVKEFGASKAGQTLTFDDNSPVAGFNNYTVTAYTAAGAGRPAVKTAYVGLDKPAVPTGVSLTDQTKSVKLDWDAASATGSNGGAVLTKDVSFNVYRVRNVEGKVSQQLIGSTQQNTYTDNTDMSTGEQQVCMYAVSAKNSKGESQMAPSAAMLSGAPYTLPFASDFVKDADGAKLWWSLTADEDNGIGFLQNTQTSADGDNQSIVYTSVNADYVADINSGKIALDGAANPEVVFAHAATTGKNGKLEVYATATDGQQKLIGTINYANLSGKVEDWRRKAFKIPAEYAKQPYVTLTFKAQSDVYGVVRLDDVHVRNVFDKDLAVSVAVPSELKRGAKTNVQVTVTNNGDQNVDSYRVRLLSGDETLLDQTVDTKLAPLASRTFSVDVTTPNDATASEMSLTAKVDLDGDQKTDDNTCVAVVKLLGSEIPQPQNLTAVQSEGSISLEWTAPEVFSKKKIEDFEDYDNWTINTFGDWQTYSPNKGSITGGLWGSMGMPFPHENEKYTYIVFNPDAIQDGITSTNASVKPHSDNKCLMSMWSREGNNFLPTDDWLISPMLSSKAQTVRVWVNNGQSDPSNIRYPQTFEVLYSDKTTAPADFVKAAEYTHSGAAWKSYTADLPEGALYFAIRCNTSSDDAYMFLVDDVTYNRGYGKLKGFNVYCNGKLVKSLDADATSATLEFDPTVWNRNRYSVSAVFDGGESDGATNDDCLVTAIRSVTVDAQHPVDVYTVDGKLVMKNATSLSALKHGVYVVNGQKIVK